MGLRPFLSEFKPEAVLEGEVSNWIGRISEISAGEGVLSRRQRSGRGRWCGPAARTLLCLGPSREEGPALLGAKVL